MQSAMERPGVVDKYTQKEQEQGCIIKLTAKVVSTVNLLGGYRRLAVDDGEAGRLVD